MFGIAGREIGYQQIIHPLCYSQLTDSQRDEIMHKNKDNIILPESGDKSINLLLNYKMLGSIRCVRCDDQISQKHQGFSFDEKSTTYIHFVCAIEIMKFRKGQIQKILALLKDDLPQIEISVTGEFRFIKDTTTFFKKSLLYYGYDVDIKIVDKQEICTVTRM
jgi:hypothetical protein